MIDDGAIRRGRWLLVPAGVVLAALEWQATTNANPAVLIADLLAGLAFFAGAIMLLGRESGRRVGLLSCAVGVAWFAGALAPLAIGVYLGPLGHLVVAYPTGRTPRAIQRGVVAAAYVAGLTVSLTTIDVRALTLLAATAVAVAGAWRSRGALRRGRWSGAICGGFLAATAIATSMAAGQGWMSLELARLSYSASLAVAAMWLAIDLRWGGWSQDALTKLVIDLGDRVGPLTLRERLADALGDQTLVVGYRRADGPGYIDEAGQPVTQPRPGSGRTVVPLAVGGVEIGMLVRDERFEPDPALADGVARAAELALTNVQLNAATAMQLEKLDASRARLIEAAESERRRIQGELRSGAMRRLASVEDLLASRPDEGPAKRILAEVRKVVALLDAFSQGLGASAELEAGLSQALRGLAVHSPVPVSIQVPPGRWPRRVEETVYFVASETLANVARHSRASHVWLRVVDSGSRLALSVEDDGVGGARMSAGSGLEGLRLRVQATGGRLWIEDRGGGGTRVTTDLPLDRAADLADAATRSAR